VRREQLEHVLRAASQIADDPDVVVIDTTLGAPCARVTRSENQLASLIGMNLTFDQ